MGESQPTSLWRKFATKAGEKIGDKIAEWLVGGAVVAVGGWLLLARHWVGNEWRCVNRQWCEVSGWSLGALIAVTIAALAVVAFLVLRLYRALRDLRTAKAVTAEPAKGASGTRVYLASQAPFSRIAVDDKRLRLRWIIRRPPREWLDLRDISRNVAPNVVQDIIDGPFHAVNKCNASLGEHSGSSGGYGQTSPTFEEVCPSCGLRVFRSREDPPGFGNYVDVWPVRAKALEEVQRLHRNGAVLDGSQAIEMERPGYWRDMLPP